MPKLVVLVPERKRSHIQLTHLPRACNLPVTTRIAGDQWKTLRKKKKKQKSYFCEAYHYLFNPYLNPNILVLGLII